jgi:hypothetical protein
VNYSLQPHTTESVRPELPTLNPGVSLALLRRVWFATPADRRVQLSTLLESRVLVAGRAKALKLFTLDEVEAAIGAVTPRFVVRFYEAGKVGAQHQTFIVESDAETFAASKRSHRRTAVVLPLKS